MAESVDATDLKSVFFGSVGSSPTTHTITNQPTLMKNSNNSAAMSQTIDFIIESTTIPDRRKALVKETKDALIAAVKAKYPEGFQEAIDKYPSYWFKSINWWYFPGAGSLKGLLKNYSHVPFECLVFTPTGDMGLTSEELEHCTWQFVIKAAALNEEEARLRIELQNLIEACALQKTAKSPDSESR